MSVSWEGKGTTGYGSTSVGPTHTGIGTVAAGDLLLCVVGTKPSVLNGSSGATVTNPPTGYTFVGQAIDWSGTNGVDDGPTAVFLFAKIAVGGESGTVTVSIANGNSSWGDLYRLRSSTGVINLDIATGSDSSSGTGFSAACQASPDFAEAGDMLVAVMAKPTDAGTFSGQAIAASGLTVGSSTEIAEYTTTTGNDAGGCAWRATVSSGSMSDSMVTASATLSNSTHGACMVIRVRDNVTGPSAGEPPVRAGASMGRNSSNSTEIFQPPIGAITGDLFLFSMLYNNTGNSLTDYAAKGWWLLEDEVVGSRQAQVYARLIDTSDASSVYELTGAANFAASWVGVLVRGHDVAASGDLTIGSIWTRNANGGSQTLTRAPSITAPDPALALALTWASISSTISYTVSGSAFSRWGMSAKNLNPEWIEVWSLEFPSGGSTGNFDWTTSSASANGAAMQIGIPGVASTPPPEGEYEAAYGWGPATFSAESEREAAYAASFGWGPALFSADVDHEATFSAAYGWGPAEFSAAADAEAAYVAAYGWGPALFEAATNAAASYEASYGWGPAQFSATSEREASYEAAYGWGPAEFTSSIPSEAAYVAAYGWGPATFQSTSEREAQYAAGYGWGPATFLTGGGAAATYAASYGWGPATFEAEHAAEAAFAASYGWGPAEFEAVAPHEAQYLAAYGWGPATFDAQAPSEAQYGATYGWGPATFTTTGGSAAAYAAVYGWGPAEFVAFVPTDFCWPNPIVLVPLGPVVSLVPEGPQVGLEALGPQSSLTPLGPSVTLIPTGPQVDLAALGPQVTLVPLGPILELAVEDPC